MKKTLKLKDQNEIPIVGFGTWKLKGKKARKSVEKALDVGYRHIDTADFYRNHKEVGKAVKSSGIPREEIFITTKVWKSDLHKQDVIDAGHRFLDELDTEYIDLLLVHWPNPSIPISETLEGFEALKSEGVIKSIGVSNFYERLLLEVLDTGVQVTNNQIEYHPKKNQQELKDFCDKNSITVTAYSPLNQGRALRLPTVKRLAEKYNKTSAQIILRWLIQKEIIVIPQSSNPDHIESNFKIFDWDLSSKDMQQMDNISS